MGRSRKRRRSGFHSVLDQYKILQSIADDYDLRMLQVEKKNGVFKVNTSQGWKKVKLFKYSQAELEYVHGALEHLAGKGWKRSMPLHLTRDGLPFVETPQGLVYVSTWVQGTEIDPEDPFHLEMAAKVLGEMHRLLEDYPGVGDCHRQFAPSWQEKYGRRAQDLERYRQQAESARKGKFGRRFCQVADDFIRMMGIGLQLLDEAGYDGVSQESKFITTCHTSPTASNLIAGNDGKIYVTDFDNARTDLRVYDLGRMLVHHSGWDVDKALFLIESYQEANPLTQEEIALLPALCAFPSRGWQVARSFYERGKIHLGRLEKAVGELTNQEAFAKALAQIQPSKLVHSPLQIFQTIPYPDPVLLEAEPTVADLPEIETQEKDETRHVSLEVPQQLQADSLLDVEATQGEVDGSHQVSQPFYWGDEDTDLDQLEDEQLRVLRHELASLARRLETISSAMFSEEPGGGDEGMGKRYTPEAGQEDAQPHDIVQPGNEIPVEVPKVREEHTPIISVMAQPGECPSNMGEEVEVRDGMGDMGLHLNKEGEVRLDLAVEMKHADWEVPLVEIMSSGNDHGGTMEESEMPVLATTQGEPVEVIAPGMEIPVEYAVGLEPIEGKEVAADQHHIVETAAREDIADESAAPDETVMVSSDTQEAVQEVVSPEASNDAEEDSQLEAAPDQLKVVVSEAEEKLAEAWEAVAPASRDPGLEEETEVALAEDDKGEKMIRDEKQPEPISSSPRFSGTTVEWGSFPEPLGGRRRSRERRSL